MQFSCTKKELSDAVSIVQRAVSSKSSLPALEGILLKTDFDGLKLFSYDLELGMYTKVNASVQQPGEIVINAKIFSDLVRKLPGERVEIKTDDKFLISIISGASEFTILGIPSSEFPELPQLSDGIILKLPQNLLSSMIKQTIFAISTDDSKPIHTGSLFEIKDGSLRVVSVDGFRLALRIEKIRCDKEMKFVVPGKTLSEIYKMLDDEKDDELSISIGKKHVLFEINSFFIISRLLEGEFLDYNNVLSGQTSGEVKVMVREFSESIDRASLLISDRLKSPVRCIFERDRIKIKCSTSIGRIYDEVPCKLSGEPLEIGFNNRYLIDALRVTECDEIKILLNGPLSPMKIYPADSESFIFLVLPVRLKTDE
jgi:DNA polymerase-3 subunit beta